MDLVKFLDERLKEIKNNINQIQTKMYESDDKTYRNILWARCEYYRGQANELINIAKQIGVYDYIDLD